MMIFFIFLLGADADLIKEIRDIVKALRIPSIKMIIHEKNLKEAILDVDTRWNTVYYMVMMRICY